MARQLRNLPVLYRDFRVESISPVVVDLDGDRIVERAEGESKPRLYEMSLSSEYPVERSFFGERWVEVLSHDAQAVDLTRLNSGAPLLLNHNSDDQIGVVEKAWMEARKVRALVRFSENPRPQEIERDVVTGIRRNVSVGYRVKSATLVERADSKKGTIDRYVMDDWAPLEATVASIPADPTVGFGRSNAGSEGFPAVFDDGQAVVQEETRMAGEKNTPEQGANGAVPAAGAAVLGTPTRNRNSEILEIRGMAKRNNCSEEQVGAWIERDLTPAQVAVEIVSRAPQPVAQPSQEALAAVPQKDLSKYSYRRAILRMSEGKLDGLEGEVHQELLRTHGQSHANGFLVPTQTRAYPLDSATSTEGAELKFTQPGELIELLRTRTAAIRLGARVMTGLSGGPIAFPRQSAAGTASWLAEESAVTDSMLALNSVTLTPKTLMSTTGWTKQLLAQSSFGVEELVRADLAAIHARAIDRAVIHGAGTNEPLGIYGVSGVNLVDMGGTGTVPTFAKLVDMTGAVADDNADYGPMAFITTPLIAATMMRTVIVSGTSADMIWTGTYEEGKMAGYRAVATNQVSKVMADSTVTGGSEHGVIFGNWAEVIIGLWGAMEFVVDPYSAKKSARIELTSFQLADIILRHAESFCKSHNAIP